MLVACKSGLVLYDEKDRARIAQSVERIHGKDEVISSILVAGSSFFSCRFL